jgi:hypothetical protein
LLPEKKCCNRKLANSEVLGLGLVSVLFMMEVMMV